MTFVPEIAAQAETIRALIGTLDAACAPLAEIAARLRAGTLKRVVLSGMGGSFGACAPAELYLTEHLIGQHVAVHAVETSELLYYGRALLRADTLLVLISQSGRSVEIVRLLDSLEARPALIAVTNDAASPLAEAADHVLLMGVKDEKTVAIRTYTATLTILHALARALIGAPPDLEALRGAADAMQTVIAAGSDRAAELVAWIAGTSTIEYLGRGPSRASATTAALISKETAKIPTESMGAGQFRHGAIEIAGPSLALVVFAGAPEAAPYGLNIRLAEDVARTGARVIVIGGQAEGALSVPLPSVAPDLLPLLEIVPIQYFVAALAQKRGYVPGQFNFIAKVTTVE